jgi:replication-associated recombination protein RarA
MRLIDKYRPKRLEQVVGQDTAVRKIRAIIDRPGFSGGALWIDGKTGVGKTTIAGCIARRLGIKSPSAWNWLELDGERCRIDDVRSLSEEAGIAGLFAAEWRIVIVNEAHAMTDKAVQAWLTLLDRLPHRWVVVFTTTESFEGLFGNFGTPLIDRCLHISLTNQGLSVPFSRLAHRIAGREGLNGQPLDVYTARLKKQHNSLRALLQDIEGLYFANL